MRDCKKRLSKTLLVLLSGAVWAVALPALAGPRECQTPAYLQQRLRVVCAMEQISFQAGPEQNLVLNQVTILASQKKSLVVRYRAIYLLGELQDPKAASLLQALLQDPDPHVRRMAAHGLGKLHDQTAVMPLIEVLCRAGEDVAVRSVAAAALGRLGDQRAKGMLTYCAGDQSAWMRGEAAKALDRLKEAGEVQRAGR